MAASLDGQLVVAISSRALFDFDEETLVFKVGGKMFCLTSLKEWEKGHQR